MPNSPSKSPSTPEFVALMALVVSLTALAIDAVLPALPNIAADLGVADANSTQLVISMMFAGFAVGQLLAGPLSDAIGRKAAIYIGIGVFVCGSTLSMLAQTFELTLVGRILQGLGSAAPRIVTTAMVRDQYAGDAMARIMSMIMAVFILVPALAPAIGQVIQELAGWRAIYAFLTGQALVAGVWLALRQPETHPAHKRSAMTPHLLWTGLMTVARERVAVGYTATAGLIFGGFLGYLMSSQQIFVDTYGVGAAFPWYFGSLALAVGAASIVNSRLVMRLGGVRLARIALSGLTAMSALFGVVALQSAGVPPLWVAMAYLLPAFFCIGILFGNFNALAMEPLGAVAGLGAAFVGAGGTLISLAIGSVIGQSYDGTVIPLAAGFTFCGLTASAVMTWTERGRISIPVPAPVS